MAFLHSLLEQFVAGPGAGQEQPEALEAETLGSEVSFALGLLRRKALLGVRGVWVWTWAGRLLHAPSWG